MFIDMNSSHNYLVAYGCLLFSQKNTVLSVGKHNNGAVIFSSCGLKLWTLS